MLSHLRPAIVLTLFFTLLTGLMYPLAMTGTAQVLFPAAARGSLIEREGIFIGSALIAQPFAGAAYLHPRASASGWNAGGTGATNLGPTSAALIAQVADSRAAFEALNGTDAHLSPETARAQADRIAAARAADPVAVLALIDSKVEGRLFGLYGLPRVNALETNLALDEAFPMAPAAP